MLRRPPSFAAGSLLTILATPHSKSFQPAVVRTWLRRRRSVATRARARGTLAGRPAKEVEPRIAKRRAAAGIALARMPAAARARTRTGGGRAWRTRVRARARVANEATSARRSPTRRTIIGAAGRARADVSVSNKSASSPRRSFFHTRRGRNLRVEPRGRTSLTSAARLEHFPFSVDPNGTSQMAGRSSPATPEFDLASRGFPRPGAPPRRLFAGDAVPGTPPPSRSRRVRPRPPRAGNPPSPRTFPWTASD